jgi:hypothetical protein
VSNAQDQITLDLGEREAARVCRDVVSKTGWRVSQQSDRVVVVKEQYKAFSGHYPAKIELRLEPLADSQTIVHINGSTLGIGPTNRSHATGQVGAFKNHIAVAAERSLSPQRIDLGDQLARLEEMHQHGSLSDLEFANAKARLLGSE